MITSIRKYKTLILAGLLAAYVAGTWPGFLLEGLHYISHMAKTVSTELEHSYYKHAHEGGQEHTHRHVILEAIGDSLSDSENDALPQKDQQKSLKKKNPEQNSIIDPIAFFTLFEPTTPAYRVYPVLKVFTTTPTPPPKAITRA